MPDDATDFTVSRMARWACFGATWIGWPEIEAIDWDELAELPDSLIHEYQRQSGLRSRAGQTPQFAKASGTPIKAQGEGKTALPDDTWFYPGHGDDSTLGEQKPTSTNGANAAGR